MPNNRQKGMVLISVATIAIFIFTNIFFVSLSSKDLKENYYVNGSMYSAKKQFSVAPYCGDLDCNYAIGETPLNCPEDCYLG